MSSVETWPAPDLAAAPEDKWRREQRAFRRLLPELLRSQPGSFVAVHGGRVVVSGPDKIEVARLVHARFGYVPIFVGRVVARGKARKRDVQLCRRLGSASFA